MANYNEKKKNEALENDPYVAIKEEGEFNNDSIARMAAMCYPSYESDPFSYIKKTALRREGYIQGFLEGVEFASDLLEGMDDLAKAAVIRAEASKLF